MTDEPVIAVGGENLIDHVTNEGEVSALAGGSPFNVAMAIGRQGVACHYLSPISTDSWGDLLATTLLQSGVTLAAGRREEPTTMARVTVTDGSPSYAFERDGTAERAVTVASLRAAAGGAGCQAVHTGSLALTAGEDADAWEAFCAEQYDNDTVVSLDPNVRLSVIKDLEPYRARILRMIAKVHVLKLSDEDLDGLLPEMSQSQGLAFIRKNTSAKFVVLTRGGEGAVAYLGEDEITVPVAPVAKLVDTVGAGDTFMATILTGLAEAEAMSVDGLEALKPNALEPILRRAAKAAAINCERAGCNPPSRAELDA